MSGLLRPDEVAALTGLDLPPGEHSDTLAGLVVEQLQSLPEVGQQVELAVPRQIDLDNDGAQPIGEQMVRLTVERLDGRRVDRVLLEVADEQWQQAGVEQQRRQS